MRGTRSSPIPIDDSEEEVLEELCDNSADSAIVDNLTGRLMDPLSPETYASTSHKRKRDEIRTDYSDAFIQGSSSMLLSPVGESKKARKRRRRLELKALEAAETFARAQRSWQEQMSNVLYGSTGGYDPNVDMNMSMNRAMFHGIDSMPTYSMEDNTNVMRSYSQNVSSGPSEWVSAMALAGSLPDPNGYSNQYQWPPPNGHPYSHNFHAQPFAPPSRSPSPPALLERVSSPILPTVNRLLPTAPNAHSITAKRAQIIGMKPDNEPHSKHGTFRFSPGNLSFFLHNNNQNPGHVGNLTTSNQHSYIPNPACTIVMEQLPKSHRTIEFVKSWAKQSSDVMPVCILVDAPSGKALVEFPSAKFSRKAWESPRLGVEYAGVKTHQLKGKPRVDQIRVWWYRVDGVGAGSGVGEIEEGEIGDDEVDAVQEQRFGHHTKQQQRQGQQDPPRQPESKKARKARLAREKQAKQGIQPSSPQLNRNLSGSGFGHNLTSGMTELTNASTPVTVLESPISPRRSPQLLKAINWKNLAQSDLQVDMQLEEVSRSPQSRHHRSSSSFRSNVNKGNAGISTPTSTDGRAEVGARHWLRDAEVTVEGNSGENSITFSKEESLTRQVRGPGDATSARASRRRSASSSSVADQVTAVTERGHVTSTCPPSPSSSSATSTILQWSELPQSASNKSFQGSQGTSPIDITQPISKPFSSSGPNYSTDASAIATSTSAVAPSFRTLPKSPLSSLTRQPTPSAQPRATVSSVFTASPLELAVKGMTPAAKAKAPVSQLNPVPVAVTLNNSTPTSKPSPIPISIPEPRIAASEQASSAVTASSGSTKLAEMKRVLMAKQKDLEETIARSKLEMTRLKESASVEAKEDASVLSSSSAEGNKAMEDRLRKLVLQSQKTRSKSAEHQRSVLPQSRSSSTSSSSISSTIPSPPVLTPPPGGPDNVVHTMSPVQTFSLEDLAVSFITETISTLKQTTTPTLVSSPIAQSLVPAVPTSRPQPQVQSQSQPQSQTLAPALGSQTTIKEELGARQKQLEQYIAESRVLMTQLTQARTKQEKDRLLGLMREKTRLMDEEKEKMANVTNGTDQATRVRRLDEQKLIRWPTCSLDGVLIISDDEYDEDEEEG
ncbi:hypothetical protein M378DRAFT_16481 [Amanita muscaria Koide BX008]|uniref:Uncharacterized protein n=1 Tax=Amanita muscaria (strain Koide BX008) TaxID=946122 RepID=A0A0C2W7H8_AMAMK|nr:hypothetical protein M378DRAFT_16481 [Amanita muscaria Koide BX008]